MIQVYVDEGSQQYPKRNSSAFTGRTWCDYSCGGSQRLNSLEAHIQMHGSGVRFFVCARVHVRVRVCVFVFVNAAGMSRQIQGRRVQMGTSRSHSREEFRGYAVVKFK